MSSDRKRVATTILELCCFSTEEEDEATSRRSILNSRTGTADWGLSEQMGCVSQGRTQTMTCSSDRSTRTGGGNGRPDIPNQGTHDERTKSNHGETIFLWDALLGTDLD